MPDDSYWCWGGHTPKVIDFAKTTRGSDVVSTIRASYYKNGERNIAENVMTGKGYEGIVEGLNTEIDGTCMTIKSQYWKSSAANFCRGNTFGATGVIESVPVRMVGRNPENPTSRKAGLPTEQRIEPTESGLCSALTSVQKDNLVLEKKPSLQYRIRKLTERECWRLMDFPDSDFDKAASVESRTQLYKQAGNTIVRAVLMALFLQMNIQGIKNWNDRTENERCLSERQATF